MTARSGLWIGSGSLALGAFVAILTIGDDEPTSALQVLSGFLFFVGLAILAPSVARVFDDDKDA